MQRTAVSDYVQQRIAALVVHLEEIFKQNNTANHLNWPADKIETEQGQKWVKFIKVGHGNNRSVYCFVAVKDFADNKALGPVKMGDIHMAASWKAPAKHARGSIFSEDFDKCCGPYGVSYLR